VNQLSIGLEDSAENGVPMTSRPCCRRSVFLPKRGEGKGRAGTVVELPGGVIEFTPQIGTAVERWQTVDGFPLWVECIA
jgi:hypothetical protein